MLPSVTDPRWVRLIEHPERYTFKMLALKILMQRVALKNKYGAGPAEKRAMIGEVRGFFEKNARLAQDDLRAIFG